MLLKNPKITKLDRKYFDEKGKMSQAANEGKLGRSFFTVNPKTGKQELRPRKNYARI